MLKIELGKLQKVGLREVWGHEALDFTKWLLHADNLGLLSDEIGIEINVLENEAPVGSFKLDILAEEEGTNRRIVIENQLEMANHDHLGKLITYASGYDASIVIWVVQDVREEHQRAIEWLNERTDTKTAFFLIRVELWQIGDSPPAPKFHILARPNGWAKLFKNSPGDGGLRDIELQQLDFWSRFRDYALAQDSKMRLQSPRAQHWYTVTMGSSEAHVSLVLNSRDKTIGCEFYIDRNKQLFQFLLERKTDIESEIGESVIWHEANVATKVKLTRPVELLFEDQHSKAHFDWLFQKTKLFQKVFSKYVKEFKAV